ncbi:MAG: hypothetical protein HY242_13230 [Afipia sp.]|nr:hypothetical protein [Afipia sp.]
MKIGAGPSCFRAACGGTDQTFVARVRADGCGQDAGHGRNRSVEAEFAEHGEIRQRVRRDCADGGHQSKRDRQIVVTSFFRQIGGGEIDGDSPRGKSEARCDQRRTHTFTRFGDGFVRKSDDGESRQTRRDLNLHIDRAGFDALESNRRYVLDHGLPRWTKSLAGTPELSKNN